MTDASKYSTLAWPSSPGLLTALNHKRKYLQDGLWIDRAGKQLGVLGETGVYNDIVLSPDEKRIAVQRLVGSNIDIWLMDSKSGLTSRFTFEAGAEDNPAWSPDGNQIVLSSEKGAGVFDLYQKVSSGAGKEELFFQSESGKEATDWSRDGRFILFSNYGLKSGTDVWVFPLFGDRKPYPLLESEFEESQAQFSPDGRWFAYVSNESGRSEVYVQSFPQSGGKWLVSTGGGAQPHWRRDGKELFYIAADRSMMAVDINTGATFEPAAPRALFPTRVSAYSSPNRYVVTGDGQRFLVNSPAEEVSHTPITIVLNWTANLKR